MQVNVREERLNVADHFRVGGSRNVPLVWMPRRRFPVQGAERPHTGNFRSASNACFTVLSQRQRASPQLIRL